MGRGSSWYYPNLAGGFEDFVCLRLFGEMIQFDYRIFSIIVIVTKPPPKDMFGKDFSDILQEFYWYVPNLFVVVVHFADALNLVFLPCVLLMYVLGCPPSQ